MQLLDERSEVMTVAERWKSQYCCKGTWHDPFECDAKDVYERLVALPASASAADVAAIIGNDSWIGESCTECGERAIVLVGQEPDYESATAYLCANCLQKLNELVFAARREDDPTP